MQVERILLTWCLGATAFAAGQSTITSGQTVTVDQLMHPMPASAAREYQASRQALDQGNLERSIAHCRKAIETDPSNAAARNDLGVLFLTAGRWEEALTEFARATAADPKFVPAMIHASYAALALGRPSAAEDSARRAVEHDRRNHRAHLLLGWSLARQGKYNEDAIESLRIAEREFPEARLAAADVQVHRGSFDAARQEVEEYLKSPNPEHQQLAAAWLRILTLN